MKIAQTAHANAQQQQRTTKRGTAFSAFDSLLASKTEDRQVTVPNTPTPRAKDEKKPNKTLAHGEEALLLARAQPASVPLFVTKPSEHKAPKAEAQAKVNAPLVARGKADHEHVRVTGPSESRKSAKPEQELEPTPAEKPSRVEEPKPPLATASTAAPTETFRIESPTALRDAAPLAQVAPLMLDDASVRAVLLPNVARVSLEAGDAGRLNVQLKVKDGVTEITATGPAAPLLEARQGELRVALAKEGLALGHFDLTQSGRQDRGAPHEAETESGVGVARRLASTSGNSTSTEASIEDGRVHVKV